MAMMMMMIDPPMSPVAVVETDLDLDSHSDCDLDCDCDLSVVVVVGTIHSSAFRKSIVEFAIHSCCFLVHIDLIIEQI